MSKDASAPAFPTVDANRQQGYGTAGMTIRQYAAIKAMQGLLANGEALTFLDEYVKATTGKSLDSAVSEMAVSYADALLAELRK